MRLVSCNACHAQYDVTRVAARWIQCSCGKRIENQVPVAIEAEARRCSACGAPASAADERCDYCGSEPERDPRLLSLICPDCCARNAEAARFCQGCGVVFRPQPAIVGEDANAVEDGQALLANLPCPACRAGVMSPRSVGGVDVHECPVCNGLWTRGESFAELIDRALEAKKSGDDGFEGFAPRVRGGNPASQQVQYRRCPECEHFMQRKNFRKTSGVIIDACNEHGTWLDMDELERIAGFLLSGGRPAADAYMKAHDESAEASYRDARAANIRAQYGSSTASAFVLSNSSRASSASDSSPLMRTGARLIDILTEILD